MTSSRQTEAVHAWPSPARRGRRTGHVSPGQRTIAAPREGATTDGGTGAQRISWVEGGRLTRPEVHLGIGAHMHGGDNDPKNTRHLGVVASARLFAAVGPRTGVGCKHASDACDPGPRSTDLGLLVTLAFTRGRRS